MFLLFSSLSRRLCIIQSICLLILFAASCILVRLNSYSSTEDQWKPLDSSLKGNFNRPSSRLVALYRRQKSMRQRLLDSAATMKDKIDGYARIYNNLAPEVYCSEKAKIGTTDDGGKWMCSPMNLPFNCVIFSLGMNNHISFEMDLQALTGNKCRLYAFDSIEQDEGTLHNLEKINGEAMKGKISEVDNDLSFEYTLESLMKLKEVKEIEILKIDIEGAELTILEPFLERHNVSQLLVEVHGSPIETLSFLKTLSRKGYLLFHYEINGSWHHLCEYAFIHETKLEQYRATILSKYLS